MVCNHLLQMLKKEENKIKNKIHKKTRYTSGTVQVLSNMLYSSSKKYKTKLGDVIIAHITTAEIA